MIRQLTEAEQAERGTFEAELGQTPRQTLRKPDRKAKNAGKRKRKAERRQRERILKLKNRLRSIPSEAIGSPPNQPTSRFGKGGTFDTDMGRASRFGENVKKGTGSARIVEPARENDSKVPVPLFQRGENGTLHADMGRASRTDDNGTLHTPVGHVDRNASANSAEQQASAGTTSAQQTEATSQGATPRGAAAEQQPHLLPDNQMVALKALLKGESNSDAARAAGVDRRTVYRWRQQPAFQAELHRIQSCVSASLRKRAAALAEESIKVLSEKLSRGDVNTALGLLKATRILNGQPLSEIDGLKPDAQPDRAVVFSAPMKTGTGSAQKVESVPENAFNKVSVSLFQQADSAPAESQAECSRTTSAPTAAPICEIADSANSPRSSATVDISDLLPPQQVAIAQLLSDKVAPEAAKEAGVTFTTLQRWMNSDAAFRQVLASCRREQLEALQTQLLNLSLRALDVLEFALQRYRNPRVAFALLNGAGVTKK